MATGTPGYKAVFTINTAELDLLIDLTINQPADPIDVTTRACQGWKQRIQGLKDLSFDLTVLDDMSDTVLQTIETAFLTGSVLSACRAVDENGYGVECDTICTSFSRPEPLADKLTRTIKLEAASIPTSIVPTT